MIDSCACTLCERLLGFPAQPMNDTTSTLPVTVGRIPSVALLGFPRSRWISTDLHPTDGGRILFRYSWYTTPPMEKQGVAFPQVKCY